MNSKQVDRAELNALTKRAQEELKEWQYKTKGGKPSMKPYGHLNGGKGRKMKNWEFWREQLQGVDEQVRGLLAELAVF